MQRLLLVAALAACHATPSPTPVAHRADVTCYTLRPLALRGSEGLHSMSHTSADVAGALAIEGGSATVTLDIASHTDYVTCPSDPAWRPPMQACAPPDAKSTTTRSQLVLTGTARTTAGSLAIDVAHGDKRLVLACAQEPLGLECTLTDGSTVLTDPFGRVEHTQMTFVLPPRAAKSARAGRRPRGLVRASRARAQSPPASQASRPAQA